MGIYKYENGELVPFDGGTTYCLPVGTIFPSAIPQTSSSVHLLDGSIISQNGIYKNFTTLLKSLISSGYNLTCTQSQFDTDVANTGNCGKFVVDDNLETIRLPKITTFIQGLSNMTDIGESIEAGLPNITGSLGDFRLADDSPTQSGAFKLDLGTSRSCANNVSASTSKDVFSFDASRSNSIYGKSSTVQPSATQYPYYIVLAVGYTSEATLDVDISTPDAELSDTSTNAVQNKVITAALNDKLSLTEGGIVSGKFRVTYHRGLVFNSGATGLSVRAADTNEYPVVKGDLTGYMSFGTPTAKMTLHGSGTRPLYTTSLNANQGVDLALYSDIDGLKTDINAKMLGAPSNRYIDISGSFTAPSNGYIAFKGVASAAHAQFIMSSNDNYPAFEYVLGYQGYGQIIYLPVKKDVTYNVSTLNISTSHSWGYYIRFYYAEEV